jgi:predicted DNA-binding transcriptional regulator YafY
MNLFTKEIICEAISSKRRLQFTYRDRTRVVEPQIFGINTKGEDLLSAYFVSGYSESTRKPGWRAYLLSELTHLTMLEEKFPGPREGYNPNDPHMVKIYCRLE